MRKKQQQRTGFARSEIFRELWIATGNRARRSRHSLAETIHAHNIATFVFHVYGSELKSDALKAFSIEHEVFAEQAHGYRMCGETHRDRIR